MLLMGLLGSGLDRMDRAKQKMLEERFARHGCSQADLRARIEQAKQAGERLQELIDGKTQARKTQEVGRPETQGK